VFVVGHLGDWKPAAEVLFESESLSGNIKPGRKEKQETSAFTASSFGAYSEGVGTIRAAGGDLGGGSETLYVPNIANCLQTTCNDYSRADGFNVIAMQGNLIGRNKGGPQGIGVSELNTMYTLTKTDVHAVAIGFNTNARPDEMNFLNEQANTLTASQNSGVAHAFKPGALKRLGQIESAEISPTLLADMGDNQIAFAKNMVVRKLTEIECERLQGFPDNYTNIKENCPSGARYKALGNSMAVPVMRWIGERINQYEQRGVEKHM
jgi:DNA (cytosine-5)-methyltransferase 1